MQLTNDIGRHSGETHSQAAEALAELAHQGAEMAQQGQKWYNGPWHLCPSILESAKHTGCSA